MFLGWYCLSLFFVPFLYLICFNLDLMSTFSKESNAFIIIIIIIRFTKDRIRSWISRYSNNPALHYFTYNHHTGNNKSLGKVWDGCTEGNVTNVDIFLWVLFMHPDRSFRLLLYSTHFIQVTLYSARGEYLSKGNQCVSPWVRFNSVPA